MFPYRWIKGVYLGPKVGPDYGLLSSGLLSVKSSRNRSRCRLQRIPDYADVGLEGFHCLVTKRSV